MLRIKRSEFNHFFPQRSFHIKQIHQKILTKICIQKVYNHNANRVHFLK